ncbi:hypothetical protein ACJMK2_036618 [Sinanodonta woodiana]|uniref:Probable ATP-dependent RNA helicase DDX52 n=1 Tax=Sinanodonta woodiana TaxID=1069815 RepID=A0ABD3WJ52_SINWO
MIKFSYPISSQSYHFFCEFYTSLHKVVIFHFQNFLTLIKRPTPVVVNDTKENQEKPTPLLQPSRKRKVECHQIDKPKKNRVSDDESNDSDNDYGDESEESSCESGSSQSDMEDGLNQDSDNELQILGNIRDKGDDSEKTTTKVKKKEKKILTAEKLATIKQEEINHVRNQHRIHVYGTDIPVPIVTFEELSSQYKLNPQIIKNIKAVGYQIPTPIQMQAIPAMLHRREVMACAPTGSGKTAAFILPILHHLQEPRKDGLRALVLAPTRELAKQTYLEFQRLSEGLGFRILYINKTSSFVNKSGAKASRKFDILVSTPNRLVYLLKPNPPLIKLSSVQWLVVDESDKLFEEGKTGFRDQLAAIYKACDGHSVRRAMFSATFAYDVEEWCKLHLDNVLQIYIGARNTATSTIEQKLLFVGSESGKLLAIRDIIRQGIQPPVLVFVQSKERAKELFHELIYDGINVDVIHSDRTQLQRDNVVKSFRAGKIWILICTDMMGRGIDFKGVNLVINYDFPNSAISYIHRIGRTGRAGRPGQATTFFTENDVTNLRSIANVMKEAGCPIPEYMLAIKKPTMKARKKLAKRAPQRDRISTVPLYDLEKANKKRKMIQNQKQRQKLVQERKESPRSEAANSSATITTAKQEENSITDVESTVSPQMNINSTPVKTKKNKRAVRPDFHKES